MDRSTITKIYFSNNFSQSYKKIKKKKKLIEIFCYSFDES